MLPILTHAVRRWDSSSARRLIGPRRDVDFGAMPGETGRLVPRGRTSPMKRCLCGLVALGLLVAGAGQARADYIFTTIDVPGAAPGTTTVSGINDAGEMVGSFLDASGAHGFLLNARGFTTL